MSPQRSEEFFVGLKILTDCQPDREQQVLQGLADCSLAKGMSVTLMVFAYENAFYSVARRHGLCDRSSTPSSMLSYFWSTNV